MQYVVVAILIFIGQLAQAYPEYRPRLVADKPIELNVGMTDVDMETVGGGVKMTIYLKNCKAVRLFTHEEVQEFMSDRYQDQSKVALWRREFTKGAAERGCLD